MKRILKSNQVIITSLAIMIAIAGYLNFSNNNVNKIGNDGEYYEAKKEVLSKNIDEKEITKEKEQTEENNVKEKQSEEKVADAEEKQSSNIGEAVMVNNNITLDYFYTVKLDREQTRAKNKEELTEIASNEKMTDKEKEVAVNKIIELTANAERESAAEMMLEAKGYENTVVSIVDGKVDVVIEADSITEEQIAAIVDVVNRKTGISNENIVITPVNAKNN